MSPLSLKIVIVHFYLDCGSPLQFLMKQWNEVLHCNFL